MRTLGDASNGRLRVLAICSNKACRRERELDLAEIIGYVGERHPLLPRLGAEHYSEKLKCPACQHRGAFVWPKDLAEPEPVAPGLSFKINRWMGDTLLETVGQASSEVVANVLFGSCLTHYPGDRLTLQQRARVVRDSSVRVIEGGRKAS